jgi:hypothetical protein
MPALVPYPFLFKYALPVHALKPDAGADERIPSLTAVHELPFLGALEGRKPFATLFAGWNDSGLALAVEVAGKKRPPAANVTRPEFADGLHLWIDTRNTQNIHRAGRFCHRFVLAPTGGGRKQESPFAVSLLIPRAREDAPKDLADHIRVRSEPLKTGYRLEAWLPAASLHGFDPTTFTRLGFYAVIHDGDHGTIQPLTVGPEFPFDGDPSLWSTLELVRD